MKGLNGVKYYLLIALLIFFTVGCSSGGDDGIDGTGMRGTAAEGEPLANAEVTLRDVDCNTRSTTTNAQGKYQFANINNMTAPFIIKVRKNDALSYYSVLPSVAQSRMNIANIHPVSDVAARNWFSSKGRDIESEFNSSGSITNPPGNADIDALRDALTGLLRFAYADFNIDANFDFIRNDFNANGMGFDGLLDNAIIVIKDNKVTIKIKDPETGFEGKIIIKFEMINDLSQADNIDPSEPTGLLVVPASSSEMVVVWDASTDNIGVAGYNVYWGSDENVSDGSATVPYPVFKHEGLTAGQTLCYAVEAVDGAGNVSSRTIINPSTHCKQTQPDDGNPPDAPTNLQVSDSGLGTIDLLWDAPAINTDIIGYRVYRSVAGGAELFHAATLLTSFEDVSVDDGVEYCYSVAAVDAAFNESAHTTPDANSCATVSSGPAIPPTSSATPAGGAFNSSQSVTLSCVTSGGVACSIYYTTDGSDPVPQASPLYTAPIPVNTDTTLKFIARDELGNNELVIHTEQYVIDAVAPTTTASPLGGSFPSSVAVTLSCIDGAGSGCATIYYTTDDSTPTTASSVYSGPISITSSLNLKFFAVDRAGNAEAVRTESYTITGPVDSIPPVSSVSIPGGVYTVPQTVSLSCVDNTGGSGCDRIFYTTDGTEPTTASTVYSAPIDINSQTTLRFFAVDIAGNEETPAHTEIYSFDSTNPPFNSTGSNFINWSAINTNTPSVTLSIAGNDIDGDLVAYYVQGGTSPTASAPLATDPGWITIPAGGAYSGNVLYMFPGNPVDGDTLYAHVWFKDAAGAVSSAVTDDIQMTADVVFSEKLDNGWGAWGASNGMWEIGQPGVGPDNCASGLDCAGTILAGNYPGNDSSFVSPPINLPTIINGQELQLRFWHWFNLVSDWARVQIQTEVSPGVWSAWSNVMTFTGNSGSVWTFPMVDLSAYAGERVRVGFLLDYNCCGAAEGWYIDDISITLNGNAALMLPFNEDFEYGLQDWWASNGSWQVGTPTVGPVACNSGNQCGGTLLDSNYVGNDTMFITPSLQLPAVNPGEEVQLRFWHWFNLVSDWARVAVSTETSPGVWSAWTNVSVFTGNGGGVWTRPTVDLSAYAGQKVRVGFLLDYNCCGAAEGWYIDDISIDVSFNAALALPYVDNFEGGLGDWWSSNGSWQVGTPSTGPVACNSGNQCGATLLNSNYVGNDTMLISPTLQMPAINANEEIQLRFWHWFNLVSDWARVAVSTETSPGVWGAWTNVSVFTGNGGGVWTRPTVDLSAYAGEKIRIGFLLDYNCCGAAEGWYIDDISVSVSTNVALTLPYFDDFESGLGDWWSSNGSWQVGTPTTGPVACNSGNQCGATLLDANYVGNDTMLVTPTLQLPLISSSEEIQLRFWHWFNLVSDWARVAVSTETAPGVWGAWTNVSVFTGYAGGVWTRPTVDLSAYAGQKVRVGFLLDYNCCGAADGWYIDDISIEVSSNVGLSLPFTEDFESGLGDWWVSNGSWQVGTPVVGPTNCNNGSQCAGTILGANYVGNDSYLVSPSLSLPTLAANEMIQLRFWHWFNLVSDWSRVAIRTETSPGVWGAWTNIDVYTGNSGNVWTLPPGIDLSAYQGQKVQIGFLLDYNCCGAAEGWYIDDVTVNVIVF
jgi:bacillopeptidase F (M6 metalloprotease family)